jgi:hypothetical protein
MKAVLAIVLCVVAAGCAHQVSFDRPAPYTIATQRHEVGAIAVIDQSTLTKKVPVSAWMTGIAHTWEVEPGDMLKQIADIELPQIFVRYDFSNAYRDPPADSKWIVLELAVPSYSFEDFRAKVSVSVSAYESGRRQLLQKTYNAEGPSQGAKMFWAGAFGMKSAIRQSSLDAYKRIFTEIRSDLGNALRIRSETAGTPAPLRSAPSAPAAVQPVGTDAYSRMNRSVEAPPAAAQKVGKFTFEAEQLAKAERCSQSPAVTLTAAGAGFENYSVPCSNGDALAVRCEMGNCRALK